MFNLKSKPKVYPSLIGIQICWIILMHIHLFDMCCALNRSHCIALNVLCIWLCCILIFIVLYVSISKVLAPFMSPSGKSFETYDVSEEQNMLWTHFIQLFVKFTGKPSKRKFSSSEKFCLSG